MNEFTKIYSSHLEKTLYVNSKEASGYGMLSNFSVLVCDVLQEKFPTHQFRIEPQFYVAKGKTYSTDMAVVLLKVDGVEVLLAWEYKPKVAADISDQTGWHLSETILQGFYLQGKHILHCLTDLSDFHYFFMEGGPRALTLKKYVYLQSVLSDPTSVLYHLSFILESYD